MTTAHEVAQELRRLADLLEKIPEAVVPQPLFSFYCNGNKEEFLTLAKIMPRPFSKKAVRDELTLEYGNKRMSDNSSVDAPIWTRVQVNRSAACRIISPAKEAVYECDPLLTEDEESTIS